jgi:hypothetical protein
MTSGTASPFILAAAFIQACYPSLRHIEKGFCLCSGFSRFQPSQGIHRQMAGIPLSYGLSFADAWRSAAAPIMDNPSYAR